MIGGKQKAAIFRTYLVPLSHPAVAYLLGACSSINRPLFAPRDNSRCRVQDAVIANLAASRVFCWVERRSVAPSFRRVNRVRQRKSRVC